MMKNGLSLLSSAYGEDGNSSEDQISTKKHPGDKTVHKDQPLSCSKDRQVESNSDRAGVEQEGEAGKCSNPKKRLSLSDYRKRNKPSNVDQVESGSKNLASNKIQEEHKPQKQEEIRKEIERPKLKRNFEVSSITRVSCSEENEQDLEKKVCHEIQGKNFPHPSKHASGEKMDESDKHGTTKDQPAGSTVQGTKGSLMSQLAIVGPNLFSGTKQAPESSEGRSETRSAPSSSKKGEKEGREVEKKGTRKSSPPLSYSRHLSNCSEGDSTSPAENRRRRGGHIRSRSPNLFTKMKSILGVEKDTSHDSSRRRLELSGRRRRSPLLKKSLKRPTVLNPSNNFRRRGELDDRNRNMSSFKINHHTFSERRVDRDRASREESEAKRDSERKKVIQDATYRDRSERGSCRNRIKVSRGTEIEDGDGDKSDRGTIRDQRKAKIKTVSHDSSDSPSNRVKRKEKRGTESRDSSVSPSNRVKRKERRGTESRDSSVSPSNRVKRIEKRGTESRDRSVSPSNRVKRKEKRDSESHESDESSLSRSKKRRKRECRDRREDGKSRDQTKKKKKKKCSRSSDSLSEEEENLLHSAEDSDNRRESMKALKEKYGKRFKKTKKLMKQCPEIVDKLLKKKTKKTKRHRSTSSDESQMSQSTRKKKSKLKKRTKKQKGKKKKKRRSKSTSDSSDTSDSGGEEENNSDTVLAVKESDPDVPRVREILDDLSVESSSPTDSDSDCDRTDTTAAPAGAPIQIQEQRIIRHRSEERENEQNVDHTSDYKGAGSRESFSPSRTKFSPIKKEEERKIIRRVSHSDDEEREKGSYGCGSDSVPAPGTSFVNTKIVFRSGDVSRGAADFSFLSHDTDVEFLASVDTGELKQREIQLESIRRPVHIVHGVQLSPKRNVAYRECQDDILPSQQTTKQDDESVTRRVKCVSDDESPEHYSRVKPGSSPRKRHSEASASRKIHCTDSTAVERREFDRLPVDSTDSVFSHLTRGLNTKDSILVEYEDDDEDYTYDTTGLQISHEKIQTEYFPPATDKLKKLPKDHQSSSRKEGNNQTDDYADVRRQPYNHQAPGNYRGGSERGGRTWCSGEREEVDQQRMWIEKEESRRTRAEYENWEEEGGIRRQRSVGEETNWRKGGHTRLEKHGSRPEKDTRLDQRDGHAQRRHDNRGERPAASNKRSSYDGHQHAASLSFPPPDRHNYPSLSDSYPTESPNYPPDSYSYPPPSHSYPPVSTVTGARTGNVADLINSRFGRLHPQQKNEYPSNRGPSSSGNSAAMARQRNQKIIFSESDRRENAPDGKVVGGDNRAIRLPAPVPSVMPHQKPAVWNTSDIAANQDRFCRGRPSFEQQLSENRISHQVESRRRPRLEFQETVCRELKTLEPGAASLPHGLGYGPPPHREDTRHTNLTAQKAENVSLGLPRSRWDDEDEGEVLGREQHLQPDKRESEQYASHPTTASQDDLNRRILLLMNKGRLQHGDKQQTQLILREIRKLQHQLNAVRGSEDRRAAGEGPKGENQATEPHSMTLSSRCENKQPAPTTAPPSATVPVPSGVKVKRAKYKYAEIRGGPPGEEWVYKKKDLRQGRLDELPEVTEEMHNSNMTIIRKPEFTPVISEYGIPICQHDIETIIDMNWLNDQVIEFYLQMLVSRSQKVENRTYPPSFKNSKQTFYPEIHAMSSYFYTKLITKGYSSVKKWTKNVNIFTKHLIFIPIHLELHWALVVVDFRVPGVFYFDSLGEEEEEEEVGGLVRDSAGLHNKTILTNIINYLKDEYREKNGSEMDQRKYVKQVADNCPQQKNGSDCGMFVCKVAEFLSRDQQDKLWFTQADIPYYRQRMIWEISNNTLISP